MRYSAGRCSAVEWAGGEVEELNPPREPVQFGLVSLFFLTAFFAALVMMGIEGGRPLPNPTGNPFAGLPGFPPLPGTAERDATVLVYAALAALMAVTTVLSMVGPRRHKSAALPPP
jgi:hypothetical protein